MKTKIQELELPEFAFLDGSEHEENILNSRTIFAHIRSCTIFELFGENEVTLLRDNVVKVEFEYMNLYGIVETCTLAVHYTLAEDEDLPLIFEKASDWYMDYCRWEDRNIQKDGL